MLSDRDSDDRGGGSVRFEATIHPGDDQPDLSDVPPLDLDRVPGPPGEVHVLLSIEDAARVVQLGFEVHLKRACRVKPFDAALVFDDDHMRLDLQDRTADVPRGGDR